MRYAIYVSGDLKYGDLASHFKVDATELRHRRYDLESRYSNEPLLTREMTDTEVVAAIIVCGRAWIRDRDPRVEPDEGWDRTLVFEHG